MRSALILLAAVAALSLPLAMPAAAFHNDFECNDGKDNDGDGLIDFPDDPGCASSTSDDESPDCDTVFDDDHDGFGSFVLGDPGCDSASDPSEHSPALPCDDGLNQTFVAGVEPPDNDNFSDFRIDGLGDPGCSSLLDLTETDPNLLCDNGIDDDGDGKFDAGSGQFFWTGDLGCHRDPLNFSERADCIDGFDNDGDGWIDKVPQLIYPAICTEAHEALGYDCGCGGKAKRFVENPECWDGIDNDGDGLIDNNGDEVLDPGEDPDCLALQLRFTVDLPGGGVVWKWSRNVSATETRDGFQSHFPTPVAD